MRAQGVAPEGLNTTKDRSWHIVVGKCDLPERMGGAQVKGCCRDPCDYQGHTQSSGGAVFCYARPWQDRLASIGKEAFDRMREKHHLCRSAVGGA